MSCNCSFNTQEVGFLLKIAFISHRLSYLNRWFQNL